MNRGSNHSRYTAGNLIQHFGWDGQLKREVNFGVRRLANISLSGDHQHLIIAVTNQPQADVKSAALLP